MRHRAAERAAIAGLEMPDPRQRQRQQRQFARTILGVAAHRLCTTVAPVTTQSPRTCESRASAVEARDVDDRARAAPCACSASARATCRRRAPPPPRAARPGARPLQRAYPAGDIRMRPASWRAPPQRTPQHREPAPASTARCAARSAAPARAKNSAISTARDGAEHALADRRDLAADVGAIGVVQPRASVGRRAA